jgi:hypothetical protein
MSGGEANYDDWECYPNRMPTDVATEGTLGPPTASPFLLKEFISLKDWIVSAREAEKDASLEAPRAGRAELVCRRALVEKQVAAQLQTPQGDRLDVPRDRWLDSNFWDSALMNHSTVEVEPGKRTHGVLIVARAGAEAVLGRLLVVDADSKENWTHELELMTRAVREIPITPDDRSITKRKIKAWFLANKRADVRISDTLMTHMATILMSPKQRTGGYRDEKQSKFGIKP